MPWLDRSGLAKAELAELLVDSAATVCSHNTRIFRRLGVRDRAQARSVRSQASRSSQRTGRVVASRIQRSVTRLRWRLAHPNREAQMTTTIVTRRPSTAPDDIPPSPPSGGVALSVGAAVRDASDVALALDTGDPRWVELGPLLTVFVDAVRRSVGLEGSPILPHEQVPTVLRLRDLALLAGRTAAPGGASVAATPLVRSGLRSLQEAARRCPSG